MDPEALASILSKMGITGIDPTKLSAAMQLAESLGESVQTSPQELQSYYPQINDSSFYLPAKPKPGFYYDAPTLRKLTTVNPTPFRKLLGIL